MSLKPIVVVAVLALGVSACSPDASVSTTVAATQTTNAEPTPSTTASEQTSNTASPSTTEAPTTTSAAADPDVLEIEIRFQSGSVEGGGRIEVPLGEPVVIRIDSDVADEGHLHGYDIFVDIEPGRLGLIEFVADIPGIFELELESAGVLLADLEVTP